MTEQSTDPGLLEREILDLISDAPFYYVKKASIVDTIEKRGRVFYSKFEKVNKKPDLDTVKKHLKGDITAAVPLSSGNRLYILYEGGEKKRFLAMLSRIGERIGSGKYRFFYGKNEDKLQVFIDTETEKREDLYANAKRLSDILSSQMTKTWKILPDSRVPESYNIFTLPYSIY